MRVACATVCALDGAPSGRPVGDHLELAAGTRVRYVETRYDALRLEETFHTVKVMSGPATGTWACLFDSVNPGPLPWEA